ncbi:MAG: Ppx/GppA family phosphatase [Candidatus Binatia bacterium]
MGKGVDRSRLLSKAGQTRSLEILRMYSSFCRDLKVDEIAAIGTSALRDATNAADFQALVKRELGWDLRILSGEEEARYSFLAVRMGIESQADNILVVDVGGGSTEFIWGRGGRLHRWASLQLGSVRLTERFLASEPTQEEECVRLTRAVDAELRAALGDWLCGPAFGLTVGIAGTFTTLAAIEKGLKNYSRTAVHCSILGREAIQRQIALFKNKTVAERKKIPGLDPKRADVILAGALLIERVMDLFRLEQLVVSDQGIRYGLLYERLGRKHG